MAADPPRRQSGVLTVPRGSDREREVAVRENVDTVVIGGGAMGSATAWQLAQRGTDVVLLEQFGPGHENGASHGRTRNFNEAYAADDYLDLLGEASRLWDRLSVEEGTTLLDRVGLVNLGPVGPLRAVREAHRARGVASELISAAEARDRWPALRFESEVLHVPSSGRVRAADALLALRAGAERRGARFRYDTAVRGIDVVGPDTVIVTTDDTEYRARRVVVTAGAWTQPLLAGLVPLRPLRVSEEHPAHFRLRMPDAAWPSFNHTPDPDRADHAYFLSPVYGMLTPGEGLKVGWHGVGRSVDPDARTRRPVAEQLAALRRYVAEWIPGADAEVCDVISCTYTMTRNEDFILDRNGPIVVGAGFSGHGFKFTPAIGRVLADLSEGVAAPRRFAATARPVLAGPVL
ncbi:FAD-dependent oxidoreductase [Rathayibacter sp. AY1A3]|nr:FAD-dependent oxidoreductase [Rathayibacter sp. AY1A3]